MANVLLIHPAGLFEASEIRFNPSYPPLGLAYLAAYLREKGHRVRILDMLGEGYCQIRREGDTYRVGLSCEEAAKALGDYQPEIIGISNPYTKNAPEAHEAAKFFKTAYPSAMMIMGGAHCSVLPEEVLQDYFVDMVCIGEGELTLAELAELIDRSEDKAAIFSGLHEIKGLAYRNDQGVTYTPKRKYLKDLDTLPLPARDLLPMENYFVDHDTNPYFMRSPMTSIITSRGCPYHCIYCSVKSVWGRSWRGRSPEKAVDEIELLVKEFGIREICINDDALATDQKRLKQFCREIIARKLNVKWSTPNGVAIWLLDKECISLMKKAGCYRLTFGLETGDSGTAAFIRKKYDREHAIQMIRYANRKGFWTIGTFIIGFPMETRRAMLNTLQYAKRCDVDLAVFYSAYPFPGTDLNKVFQELHLHIPPSGSVTQGGVDTNHLNRHEISYLRNRFMKIVTLHRLLSSYKVLWKLRSWEEIRFSMNIFLRALNIIMSPLKHDASTSKILKG